MSDNARSIAEANAERRRIENDHLLKLGITPAISAILGVMHYGMNCTPEVLPSCAWREYYCPEGPEPTVEECEAAMADCFARGWIRIIDEQALAEIVADLRANHVLGPVYGLPEIGGIDFTNAGADLWLRHREWRNSVEAREPFAYIVGVHEKTTRYVPTLSAAVKEIEAVRMPYDDATVVVVGPTLIGPWRAQWWRRFPEGYRIDVERRWQWTGSCPSVGESCHLVRPLEIADRRRLSEILERQGVTLGEWIFLSRLEHGPLNDPRGIDRHEKIAETIASEFGLSFSAQDYRNGLETCIKRGWITIIDQHFLDGIDTALQEDPAFLAVPKMAHLLHDEIRQTIIQVDPLKFSPPQQFVSRQIGAVEFTMTGAEMYRKISAEWLGSDWEERLEVSRTSYCEIHRYCDTEAGFEEVVAEYEAEGGIVRAQRIATIGPWCVHWWKRFPAGFRLELEIYENDQLEPALPAGANR